MTHSAKQPQHRQEQETLWRGEQGREKSLSSPAPENNKGDFPPFNRRSRRSEPWLLLTWSRASSPGLLLTPRRSPLEDVEAERQDKQRLSGMCCPGGFPVTAVQLWGCTMLPMELLRLCSTSADISAGLLRTVPANPGSKNWSYLIFRLPPRCPSSTIHPKGPTHQAASACSTPGLTSAEMLTAVHAGTKHPGRDLRGLICQQPICQDSCKHVPVHIPPSFKSAVFTEAKWRMNLVPGVSIS